MQKSFLILMIMLTATVTILIACQDSKAKNPKTPIAEISKDSLIKRGAHLVITHVCDDCHSPKGPDHQVIPELRLSGFQQNNKLPQVDVSEVKKGWVLFNPDLTSAVGMWGASFAANLTSDPSGIGNWSEEQFRNALRKGKFKGLDQGRDLLPPMPWQNFGQMSDEDIKAIYTFLKSTKPVRNVVPAPRSLKELN